MKDWYAPGAIKYTQKQVLWLLQNLGTLRTGRWPPEASNYIDPAIRPKSVSRKAPYATPIEFAAEIEERLERCGAEGLMLEAMESWDKSLESLARYFGKRTWTIRARAGDALRYVASGPSRRWQDTKKRQAQSYQEFKRSRRDGLRRKR